MPLWSKEPARPVRHPDPDQAIADYMERLRKADVGGAPASPAIFNGLGDAYLDKEDVDAAVDYFRQAAEAYEAAGLHDNAIACGRKILRHRPDAVHADLLIGRSCAAKGLRADALAVFEKVADSASDRGRREDRIEALKQIVRLAPDRTDRREQLDRLLPDEGRPAVQKPVPSPAVSEAPASPAEPPAPESFPLAASTQPSDGSMLEIEHTSYVDRQAADDARALAIAATDFRLTRRWPEAINAYRDLAAAGRATAAQYAEWAECARQAGSAARVLEALEAAAEWHAGRKDLAAARSAAEEMLLIDPDSAAAARLLERLGASPPKE